MPSSGAGLPYGGVDTPTAQPEGSPCNTSSASPQYRQCSLASSPGAVRSGGACTCTNGHRGKATRGMNWAPMVRVPPGFSVARQRLLGHSHRTGLVSTTFTAMFGSTASKCGMPAMPPSGWTAVPASRTPDSQRVLRGGSWSHNPAMRRSAYRDSIAPGFSGWQGRIGVRVVCTV